MLYIRNAKFHIILRIHAGLSESSFLKIYHDRYIMNNSRYSEFEACLISQSKFSGSGSRKYILRYQWFGKIEVKCKDKRKCVQTKGFDIKCLFVYLRYRCSRYRELTSLLNQQVHVISIPTP